MKYIQLSNNKQSIVDDGDFDWLNQWNWSWQGNYAHRMDKDGKHIYMHRLILNTPNGMYSDHINGDKLDNRRSNLRVCTNSENMRNRGLQKNNTSDYVGVNWNKANKAWEARIKVHGKYTRLGYFKDIKEAIKARAEAVTRYHKEFARAT